MNDKEAQKGLKGVLQSSRATIEQWQHAIDERIRAVLPNFSGFRELQQDVKRLHERLEALEKKVGGEGKE